MFLFLFNNAPITPNSDLIIWKENEQLVNTGNKKALTRRAFKISF